MDGFSSRSSRVRYPGFERYRLRCACDAEQIFRFCRPAIAMILILGFQKWSPPGPVCVTAVRCACDVEQIFRFRLGSSDDHPDSDPGILRNGHPRARHVTAVNHWNSVSKCPLCAKSGHASYFGSTLTCCSTTTGRVMISCPLWAAWSTRQSIQDR